MPNLPNPNPGFIVVAGIDGSNAPSVIAVDDSGKVTVTGTVTTTPPSNASTNVAQINGVTPLMGNGTTGTGSQRVTIASDNTAFAVNATLSAETTKVIGTVRCLGNAGAIFDAATAATVPANAIQQGARAATAYPTAVTDGQLVGEMADKAGRLVTVLNTPRDLVGTAIVSNNSTASGVSFIGAGAAGVFNDIITFVATNRSSTATVVTLTDGTASYTFALAGNGGIVINYPTPLPATSSATAWTIGNSANVACDYHAVYAKNK